MDNHETEPEVPAAESLHFRCDCVPELGPAHCHGCSEDAGHPVSWFDAECPEVGR